ncbi:hypothetical protein ASPZODRAFT_1841873 [Penicilliopsis zonata CBS 506.65]|uniref:Uncharacterized protein n=1 Tax=Penicilliopsis zonata CBS 506.65 TaxID=1073090 RepID=A0A1L9SI19_9EURO|nr:hypothetical protein ASPZODRAFT_1841873 [Penicilliopsis zonata CBS 506.65]OJJ46870.1 hypothetical protein ASPZODRAFT_1841873 [Penicilliopsis zonata CBS 506.65]
MKHFVAGVPLALLVAAVSAQTQVIGGPSGFDGGNSVDVPIEASFTSDYTEVNKDVHVEAPWRPHGPKARRGDMPDADGHVTLIGAPSGVDEGNSFVMPITVDYTSTVTEEEIEEFVNPGGEPHPGPERRWEGPSSVIGGPAGFDGGNSVSEPVKNDFVSEIVDKTKNVGVGSPEHRRPGPHGRIGPEGGALGPRGIDKGAEHKNADWDRPATVIGGPSGVDGGNSVDVPITDSYTSNVVDVEKNYHIHIPPHPYGGPQELEPRAYAPHSPPTTVMAGPSGDDEGNSVSAPLDNEYTSNVYEETPSQD